MTYTGHSAKHDGLQGHSLGDLYPLIITGYGDGSSGVLLGSAEIRGMTDHTARVIAGEVKEVLDSAGWEQAVIALHTLNIVRL